MSCHNPHTLQLHKTSIVSRWHVDARRQNGMIPVVHQVTFGPSSKFVGSKWSLAHCAWPSHPGRVSNDHWATEEGGTGQRFLGCEVSHQTEWWLVCQMGLRLVVVHETERGEDIFLGNGERRISRPGLNEWVRLRWKFGNGWESFCVDERIV
jgi:hypothetical protein